MSGERFGVGVVISREEVSVVSAEIAEIIVRGVSLIWVVCVWDLISVSVSVSVSV